LSNKIHPVVDAVGLPVRLLLTPGQASDKTTLPSLIAGLRPAREAIADRGYSARSIIELFAAVGTTAHIPSQSNVRVVRTVDPERYRQRNLIERFFNKLKHFAPDRNALRRAREKLPRRSRPGLDPYPDQTL
jgi:transposase